VTTEHKIGELIATGYEHHARDRYGDQTVDAWFRRHGIDPDAARQECYRISKLLVGADGPVRTPVTHDTFLHDDTVVIACAITGQPRLLVENTLADLYASDGPVRILASPSASLDTYDVEIELG
jgi:hypothetical protein